MSTAIRYNLPIKNLELQVALPELFADAMESEPIYSYWIPATLRRELLLRIFRDRLVSRQKDSCIFLSSDCKCAAILSFRSFSRWSWIAATCYYIRYLPFRFLMNWLKLIAVAHGLKKQQMGKAVIYLEAIVTDVNSRQQGHASNIIKSIEEYAQESCASVICETHDGSLRKILEARGWKENILSAAIMQRLGARFMVYQNPQL